MTVAPIFSVVAATAAFILSFLTFRFGRAPGWHAQTSFSAVAFWAGCYAVAAMFTLGDHPVAFVAAVEVQVFVAALQIFAWSRYADDFLQQRASRPSRWLQWAAAASSVLVLVPGVGFTGETISWHIGDHDYFDAVPTPLGNAVLLLMAVAFGVTVWRLSSAAWRRKPRALMVALCSAAMLVMGVLDALTTAGVTRLPYVLDAGFLLPIGIIAWELVVRFGEDARALAELRTDLEAQVLARTRELEASQRALVRAESLAALGRMAASVAHEVNNPAAAVIANLQFIASVHRKKGAFPDETLECLEESERATQRIAKIARQLLDSSRLLGGRKVETTAVSVVAAVRESLHLARSRCPEGVELRSCVREDLWVTGQPEALVQVLVNLVLNGADAIKAAGRGSLLEIGAERRGGRITVTVTDDGPGMPDDVLARAFEPFFSTKPLGQGTGLGLTVSRGLVAGMGGELRLESTPGVGTRAILELEATAAPVRAAPEAAAGVAPGRLRVLLVDDDPAILSSLGRMLRSGYEVVGVATVAEALAELGSPGRFDVVLADVMMPDGGACELSARLLVEAPDLARRLVFLTAGVTDEGVRGFLEHSSQPVLEKPLDPVALREAIESLREAGGLAALRAMG